MSSYVDPSGKRIEWQKATVKQDASTSRFSVRIAASASNVLRGTPNNHRFLIRCLQVFARTVLVRHDFFGEFTDEAAAEDADCDSAGLQRKLIR
jgi:hypothetical protein